MNTTTERYYRGTLLRGLRFARVSRGHSLRELAALSGVPFETIGRLERLKHGALPATIRKLAKALHVHGATLVQPPHDDSAPPPDATSASDVRATRVTLRRSVNHDSRSEA